MRLENNETDEFPDVRIEPQLVVCGSPLIVGQEVVKTVTITNHGDTSARFQWPEQMLENDSVSFTPTTFMLLPSQSKTVSIRFRPSRTGNMKSKLICNVVDTKIALCSWITATIRSPAILFDCPSLEFGVLPIKENRTIDLKITNPSSVVVPWTITGDSSGLIGSVLGLSQLSGQLKPRKSTLISLTVQHDIPLSINTHLQFQTESNCKQFLSVTGRIQDINVRITEPLIDYGEVFEESSTVKKTFIRNLSHFPTPFCWYIPNTLGDRCEVKVSPQHGTLGPSERIEVSVTLFARVTGDYELLVPCVFYNSEEHVQGVLVKCKVRGLLVRLDVESEEKAESLEKEETTMFCHLLTSNCITAAVGEKVEDRLYIPEINFGDVPIFSRKTVVLKITNLSDCIGFFSAQFERYAAPIDHSRRKMSATVSFHPHNKASAGGSRTSEFKSALKSTSSHSQCSTTERSFAVESSEHKWQEKRRGDIEKVFDSEILSRGLGIALDINRLNGRINSFKNSTVKLKLTCYSNALGEYVDSLKLEIVGLPTIQLPVRARIVGTPLSIIPKTIGLHRIENGSYLLKWHISPTYGDSELTKTIILRNDSLQNFTVRWKPKDVNQSSGSIIYPLIARINAGKTLDFKVVLHPDSSKVEQQEIFEAYSETSESIIDQYSFPLSLTLSSTFLSQSSLL